jgi:hypothetical protein
MHSVLVGDLKERDHLEDRRRWEDNIKVNLHEVGCGGMDWIELAHDTDTCECGNEPLGSIKCGVFLD